MYQLWERAEVRFSQLQLCDDVPQWTLVLCFRFTVLFAEAPVPMAQ